MNSPIDTREDAGVAHSARQVLTFSLGREIYGVDILRVKEIRGWSPVTRLPQSPHSILGVLNLRGLIVPILDLRVHFGFDSAQITPLTVIIVLSLGTASGQRDCGIVVDSVRDVVDIAAESIRAAPSVGNTHAATFIEGIATHDEQMLILLDAESLATTQFSFTEVASQAA